MTDMANDHALDLIFREARTYNAWTDASVPETLIRHVYDLARLGPTSANNSPARFVFIGSEAGKKRLEPFLSEGNRAKTMSAPWVAIIAWDYRFHEKLPQLFPHNPGAKDWFEGDAARVDAGERNGTLQGAYLMLAARALGLDCGPMSGFDKAGVTQEFFEKEGGEMAHWRADFLCSIGHGSTENLFPRSPRLSFEEACRVL